MHPALLTQLVPIERPAAITLWPRVPRYHRSWWRRRRRPRVPALGIAR